MGIIRDREVSAEHKQLLSVIEGTRRLVIPRAELLARGVEAIYIEIRNRRSRESAHNIISTAEVAALAMEPTRRRLEFEYLDPARGIVYYNADYIKDFSFVKIEDLRNARPNMPDEGF